MKTLDEKLAMIEKIIDDENFRKNKGLGNEVGYYIFDYPATAELKVREYLEKLLDKNKARPQEYKLVIYDLYDIMLDLIEEEGLMDSCIEMEKNEGLDYLILAVNDILRTDYNNNYFNNYIEKNTPDNSIVFITGIGKIFPFARVHGILNKLHLVFDRAPVILFYPGKYDGQSLVLFSEFKDGNYYRAFPLIR